MSVNRECWKDCPDLTWKSLYSLRGYIGHFEFDRHSSIQLLRLLKTAPLVVNPELGTCHNTSIDVQFYGRLDGSLLQG